jgi:hypothetical protein
MPHLHLPSAHTEADLILAANLADIVGSEDLFVAWTHESGAGAIPAIEAYVRDERPNTLAHLIVGLVTGAIALWHGITQPAPPQHASAQGRPASAAAGEPTV